ncbi:MAG: hypothetical protein QXK88_10000 [Desulfurococcaceae archaeon]
MIDRLWNNTNKSDHIVRVKVPTLVVSEILTNILGRSRHFILKEVAFGVSVSRALKEFEIIHANTA